MSTGGSSFHWSANEPAMTFEEIGKALGVSRQVVYADYCRAINKLKQSRFLERLTYVAALRKQMADERQGNFPDW